MHSRPLLVLLTCLALTTALACFEDPAGSDDDNAGDGDSTSTGDGDGDPSGDGDGDPTGDGDPSGDGDPTGDGDPSGDGDPTGDGDPSGDGDGDGDPSGDGDGDPCAECGPLELCHEQACVPAAQVIYLNFEAEGNFSFSAVEPPDARINRHDRSVDLVGALAGFEGDAFERQQILDLVRADFADFRVVVTDERPVTGEYSMIVFSEHPDQNPNVVALPMDDCGDTNANDVAFVFFNLIDISHQQRANFVSKVAAQFAGLDNLVAEDPHKADIMYPYLNETDPTFTDNCRALGPNAGCDFNHQLHCNMPGMQNAWAELNAAWGF